MGGKAWRRAGLKNRPATRMRASRCYPGAARGPEIRTRGAPARLELLDVQGRRVQAIEVGDRGPGSHVARFAAVLDPGVYFVRLTSDGRDLTRRVTRVP